MKREHGDLTPNYPPMSHHSVLFNSILDRENASRIASLALSLPPARPSFMSKKPTYLGGDRELASPPTFARDDYHPQYKTDLRLSSETSRHNPSRSSEDRYGRHSGPSTPGDFSGLIPMYGERGSSDLGSRGELIDISFTDWPTSNVAQYSTFQRNNRSSGWQPPSDARIPTQTWNPDSSLSGGSSVPRQFHDYGVYSPDSPYSSSSSSSPSLSYFLPPSEAPSPPLSRRRTADQGAKKSCFHCHVTSTPLWRREPATQRTLCNACGLYLQQRNKLRPQELIDADIDYDTPQIPDEEYTGPKCSHCGTRQTSVWRRSKTGAQVCNACGVYQRLRGKERPLSLRRNKIKPRTKHAR
ncbi:hypothetical protein B0H17DRAFT_1108459 [Mycena rosella]|uniref:GATA-type domain-containing protein n=1 Tax=Mycena rosella TaxID=1033263 RepID=A0AAD7FQ79_MYCRO|nr:hypothetical protein B0H17DRAFT_1108459 [Mycena rosella]